MEENINQDLQKELRREAIKRNWQLFKQSKLGMIGLYIVCLLYTSPSPRDGLLSRMPSSA